MGVVDWMKHHSWWLSIPAGLAFERLLSYLTSVDLLGTFWKTTGPALRADLTLPVWALAAVVAPLLMVISWLYRKRSQLSQSLTVTTTELETLKQPKTPAPICLSSDEETVLFWAVFLYNTKQTGAGVPPVLLSEASKLPLTTVEAALDGLKQQGAVRLKKLKHDPVDLTPEGRTYMGRQTVATRYEQFEVLATNDLIDRAP